MAKNRRFKRQYLINIEGITTNDFAIELMEKTLKNLEISLDTWFKQISVTIEPVEKVEENKA